MCPRQPQPYPELPPGSADDKAHTLYPVQLDVPRGNRRRRRHTEVQHGGRRRAATPLPGKWLVGIDNGKLPGTQTVKYFSLGGGHVLDTAETLQMGRPGVQQQGHRGLTEFTQPANIAGSGGTHFHHRKLDARLQPQQGQWHADFIVEITLGREGSAALGQHRAHHILDRGFTATAGDRHQRPLEEGAVVGPKPTQGDLGILHLQQRQRCSHRPAHQRRDGARQPGPLQEIMTIEILAPQSHKQFARAQRAAVGVHAAEFTVSPHPLRLQWRFQFTQGQHAHHACTLDARAACACSASLK